MSERKISVSDIRAEVLSEVSEGLMRGAEAYFNTALELTGDDNTRYHAYAVAYRSIAHQIDRKSKEEKNGG